MRFITRLVTGSFASLLLAAAASTAEDGVDLAWKFKPEDKWTFRITETKTNSSGAFDMRQESKRTLVEEMVWRVVEVKDGSAEIEATWPAIKAKVGDDGYAQEWSSDMKERPADFTLWVMTVVAGRTVRFRLSPRGEVSDVRGIEGMYADRPDWTGGNAKDKQAPKEKKEAAKGDSDAVDREFEAEWVAELQRRIPVLPDGKAKPGEGWSHKTSVRDSISGLQTTLVLYKAEGDAVLDKDGVATIGLSFRRSIDEKSKWSWEVRNGPSKGTIKFDASAGRLLREEWEDSYYSGMGMLGGDVKAKVTVEVAK